MPSTIHYGIVKCLFDFLQVGYNAIPSQYAIVHGASDFVARDIIRSWSTVTGVVEKNGMRAVYFPDKDPFSVWKRSGAMTANLLVTLLKIFINLIEVDGQHDSAARDQANSAVFV